MTDPPTGPGQGPPRQVGAPEGNVVLDLFVLQQRVGELMGLALAGTPVRPAEYAVYSQLGTAAMTPGELSARLGLTPSTLTGHLAAIERRGHLVRERDPWDGRSHRVRLTSEGREVLGRCRRQFGAALRRLNRALPTEESQVRETLAMIDEAAAVVVEQLRSRPQT